MSGAEVEHQPVLCDAVLSLVKPQPGEVVVDATAGHGGHASLLARAIGSTGRLIGLDVDAGNLAKAAARVEAVCPAGGGPKCDWVRSNFAELPAVLTGLGVGSVDVILADLGPSTDQLTDSGRGLSFSEDGPLDMRLDDRLDRDAADLVNSLSESALSDLLWEHSQERYSRRIAKRICQDRRETRIRRTSELVRIVCSALGVSPHSHPGKIHPATRTFMALRMAVNSEVANLESLLKASPDLLGMGGRLAVISFHSGEDRIVKHCFLDCRRAGVYDILTKKPVPASREEAERNPRSRSAKLRVAVRVAGSAS